MSDQAFALLQSLLPKHLLSRAMYAFMRQRNTMLRNAQIKMFLSSYRVDMSEALQSDPFAYESFNAFFTRALKPDARPIDTAADAIVSPVDGTVSQCGEIRGDDLIQAKGHDYSLLALLGGDAELAQRYQGGQFACIYLAPYNYHRMHMPVTGTVSKTLYVPGDLFSVSAATARSVPGLFARNERVVCDFICSSSQFDTAHFNMIWVGALFVGSIETVWAGEINPPPRRRSGAITIISGVGTQLRVGEEAGRFNMGSTVVLLFERGHMHWQPFMQPGAVLRMGQRIGSLAGAAVSKQVDIDV
jgi:phosphatidylserine decarboxylase